MRADAYTGKSKPCPGGYRIPVKWNCRGSVEESRKEQVQTRLVGAINKEVDKFAKSDERRTRIAFHTKDGDSIADFQLKKNSRMLNGRKVDTIEIPIIDFHEKLRGFGTADAILEHIQKKFPDRAVYIEMVQHRWAKSLANKGWETQLNPEDPHERNLYRMPKNTRKDAMTPKEKISKIMREYKAGELNIGKSDKKVKSRRQAIAIALSKSGQSRKDSMSRILERMDKECGRGWVGTNPPGCKRAPKGEKKATGKKSEKGTKKVESNKFPGFLGELTDIQRANVFDEMNQILETARRNQQKHEDLRPPHGTIGIGSADMDSFFKAEVGYAFHSALSKGKTPEQARDEAKQAGQFAIKRWNETGVKSRMAANSKSELERWENGNDQLADDYHRRVRYAMTKKTSPIKWNPFKSGSLEEANQKLEKELSGGKPTKAEKERASRKASERRISREARKGLTQPKATDTSKLNLLESEDRKARSKSIKAKFKKQDIELTTVGGRKSISAESLGELAVHKNQNGGGYAITHTPSGMMVGQTRTVSGAKNAAKLLQNSGIDWSGDPTKLEASTKKKLGEFNSRIKNDSMSRILDRYSSANTSRVK